MKTASPLRYPGGKSALSGLLGQILRLNGLGDRTVCEPYAGGAGASLLLLYHEETAGIHINDLDPAIHDFWWALTQSPDAFIALLDAVPVDLVEWRRQRAIYRDPGGASRLERGFAAFYLNRCNHSGIVVDGGPIGGIGQAGKWKIGARFNRNDLRSRCLRIAEYGPRIAVSSEDGVALIEQAAPDTAFLFIDPPYYTKGPLLYMNKLDPAYHERLAAALRERQDQA